jgi:hypothetical protein
MNQPEAYFVSGVVNQENSRANYWRADRICDDGRFVCATGITQVEAEVAANIKMVEINTYLKRPSKEKLRVLLDQSSLGSTTQEEAIRLLADIVLNQK